MKERKIAVLVWVFVMLFSFSLNAADLFDLEGGADEGAKEETAAGAAAPAEDSAAENAESGPKAASVSAAKVAADAEAEKEMSSLVVEEKDKLKVVQKREFSKDGRFEIGVGAGLIGGDWDNVIAGGAHMAYHFTEHFALKGRFIYGALQMDRDTREQVEKETISKVSSSNMKMAGGLGVVLTPFYGKMSLFGNYVPKFDLNVGFGGYFYQVELENEGNKETGSRPAVNTGIGTKFYLSRTFTLDLNWDWFMMKDERFKAGESDSKRSYLKTDMLFTVNVSMLLP